MRIQPIAQEGLDEWLAEEWSVYANTISVDKDFCLFLKVKVGELRYQVGKAMPGDVTVLYDGKCSTEALRVWNKHRLEA